MYMASRRQSLRCPVGSVRRKAGTTSIMSVVAVPASVEGAIICPFPTQVYFRLLRAMILVLAVGCRSAEHFDAVLAETESRDSAAVPVLSSVCPPSRRGIPQAFRGDEL